MRKDNEELYTIRKESFNPLEWEENAWNFFQIAHIQTTLRVAVIKMKNGFSSPMCFVC